MSFRVAIIGAGLGGLACAHGLARLGAEVVVYERDAAANARPQGYRIQLDPPGLTGLSQCLPADLMRACLATAGVALPPPRVVDRMLRPTAEHARMPHAYSAQTQAYPFNRATLREILLADLVGRVRFGKELSTFQRGADGRITACFTDGTSEVADLLVGADGVGSAVRRELLPHAQVEDTGMRLIYGKIPLADKEALPAWVKEAIFTVATGPGHAHVGFGPVIFRTPPNRTSTATMVPPFGFSPVADYVACMVGAPADHPDMPAFDELRRLSQDALRRLAERLMGAGWHPDIHRALDRWDTRSLFPLRVSSAATVEHWSVPGVTLLGDAVHAMSPVLAMGANTALRDAGELTEAVSEALAGGSTLEHAITTYQKRMLGYSLPLIRASRRIGQQCVGQR